MDTLLVVKIILLIYIVISPFISYKYMTFINATLVKILILLLIILVSFIDLQLAVLLMIAFLILLVNLNKELITKIKARVISEESRNLLPKVFSEMKLLSGQGYKQQFAPEDFQQKENMIRGNSLYPLPSDIMETPEKTLGNVRGVTEPFSNIELDPKLDSRMQKAKLQDQLQEQLKEQTRDNVHGQTMYDFPVPYCKGVQNLDPYLISNNLFLYSTDDRTKAYDEYVKILSPECALRDAQTNEL